MGDARLELVDAQSSADEADALPDSRAARPYLERLGWTAAVAALAVAVAILLFRPAAIPGELRVEVSTPPTPSPESVAISPDGTALVFVASSGTDARLWLRSLHSDTSRQLPGTQGANAPFWSPDSKAIGFFADRKLKRVNLEGGSVQTLANAATGTEGTWGRQNVILFAARGNPISRVSTDQGGDPVPVNGLVQASNFSPSFLPDGRYFLYYVRGSPEVRGVYVGSLDGTVKPQRLLDSETGAVYAASGHLLFVLRNTLLAQPFDTRRLSVFGEPFAVAALSSGSPGFFGYAASVSDTGSVAYRTGSVNPRRQFTWFDRSGKVLEQLGSPTETFSMPSLSRDGKRVVFYRGLEGNVDIWTMDTARGTQVRVTTHPADDVAPVWSPDGSRVAFSSNRSGTLQFYVRPVGEGREELVLETPAFKIPTDWSSDGRFLLFTAEGVRRSLDIWALPLVGKREPFPVVHSAEFTEDSGQFSPDGRWIAYHSNESGRQEIYIRAFPDPRAKVPISSGGGSQPRWSRDGRELLYVARDGDLMSVPLDFPADDEVPSVGTPAKLFTPPLGFATQLGDARHQYMLSPDGTRVLVATVTAPPPAPISLILNWKARP